MYFITICTQDKECLFGNIANGEMQLNEGGQIANKYWLEIPIHFQKVILHEFIVMPNHVHGNIELQGFEENIQKYHVGAEYLQPIQEQRSASFGKVISGSIGSIVRGFKSGVTKWYRSNTDIYKVWQRNYHEHIIRDSKSYTHIAEYIINNPLRWNEDRFYI